MARERRPGGSVSGCESDDDLLSSLQKVRGKMQTSLEGHKPRGRLSREVQHKLGESLKGMFDEIVKQGVPDRFAQLLQRIDDPAAGGAASDGGGVSPGDQAAGVTTEPSAESLDRRIIGSGDEGSN